MVTKDKKGGVMFKIFKKLVFVAGAALACTDGEATTITIAGRVDVSASGVAEFTRAVPLADGAKFKNYGIMMEDTEAHTFKIGHPAGAGEVAAINNFGSVDAGDASKISGGGVYDGGSFAEIRAMALPFLDAHLIDTSVWGTAIGDTDATDGINLIMGATIPADYNSTGGAAVRSDGMYDFQGNPNDPTIVGSRTNYLTSASAITIDTSDTAGQPSYDATDRPCGIEAGATNTFHWPVNMGSKVTGTDPEQASTIRAMGGGIVRLEGDNSFYQVGTVESIAGTNLLVTTSAAMPQSDITVGKSDDAAASQLTVGDSLASATTFTVGSGKTLATVAGTSDPTNIAVTDKAVLNASAATVNIATGTTVTVNAGGKITF